MKKCVIFSVVFFFVSFVLQMGNLAIAQRTLEYYDMDQGTDADAWIDISEDYTNVKTGAANTTNTGILVDIGFDFVLGTETYTRFWGNGEGLISFTGTPATENVDYPFYTDNYLPKIVGMGLNGYMNASDYIHCKLVGDEPNRILVVEFRMRRNGLSGNNLNNNTMLFQIQLFETTNSVRIVYSSAPTYLPNVAYQIGIKTSDKRYILVSSTDVFVYGTGTTNAADRRRTVSTWPGENKWYSFTPSCRIINAPVVNAVTRNTAQVAWNERGYGEAWTVEWGTGAPGAVGNNKQTVTESPFTMTNLTPGTAYNVYVYSTCECGTHGFKPRDTVMASFTTECTPIADLPYSEDFNEFGSVDDKYAASGYATPAHYAGGTHYRPACWRFPYADTSSTDIFPQSYLTGDASLVVSGKAMVMRSDASSATATKSALAALPAFERPIDDLRISFSYRNSNAYNGNRLQLGYITGDVDAPAFYQIGADYPLSETYSSVVVDLSRTGLTFPADARLAFRLPSTTSSSTDYYAVIDNVLVDTALQCASVQNLAVSGITTSSATLTWDAVAGAQRYVVRTIADGLPMTPGNSRFDTVASARLVVPGLAGGTLYHFYVKTLCDATTASDSVHASAATHCASVTLPYFESFNSYAAGGVSASPTVVPSGYSTGTHALPACWRYLNLSTGASTYPQTFLVGAGSGDGVSYTLGSNGNAMILRNDGNAARISYVALPAFTSTLGNLYVSLYYRNNSVITPGTTQLGYMTDPDDPTTFVAVQTLSSTMDWTFWEHDFGVDGGSYPSNAVFAIRYQGGSVDNPLHIDNVYVAPSNSCRRLAGVVVSALTPTSATISWHNPGNASRYRVIYGMSGFGFEIAGAALDTVETSSLSATIAGLSAGQNYDFYVQPYCGAAYGVAYRVSATTPCAAVSFHYVENFDGDTYNDEQYYVDNATTPDGVKSPVPCWYFPERTADYTDVPYSWLTTTAAYVNGSRSLVLKSANDKTAYAVLPYLGQSVKDLRLSFKYRHYDNGFVGTAQLIALRSPYDIASSVVIKTLTGSSQMIEVGPIDIADFGIESDEYKYLGFRLLNSSTTVGYLYIDDINVINVSSCAAPIVLFHNITDTSAVANWNVSDDATGYIVYYGGSDFDTNNSATFIATETIAANVAASGYKLHPLTASTQYNVSVRTICGGNTSYFGPIASFSTNCLPTALPYSYYFDGSDVTQSTNSVYPTAVVSLYPPCWTFPGAKNNNVTDNVNYYPQIFFTNQVKQSGTRSMALKSRNAYAPAVAVAPFLDRHVSRTSIGFYERVNGTGNSGQLQLGVMTDCNDTTTFRPLQTYTKTTTLTYHSYNFANAGLSEDTVYYIAFRMIPQGSASNNNVVYVDNVDIWANMTLTTSATYVTAYEQWCAQHEWNCPDDGIDHYQLRYSDIPFEYSEAAEPPTYIDIDNIPSPRYLLRGLEENNYYYFKVRGVYADGTTTDWTNTTNVAMATSDNCWTKYVGNNNDHGRVQTTLPTYPYSYRAVSQQIFDASELREGWITRIFVRTLDYTSGTLNGGTNRIWLGHTDKSNYESVSDWIHGGMTNVWNGGITWQKSNGGSTFNGTTGWTTIDITDYYYDGVSNIVLAWDKTDDNRRSQNIWFATTSTSGNKAIYWNPQNTTSKTNIDVTNPDRNALGVLSYRNDIVFEICSKPPAAVPCASPTNVMISEVGADTAVLTWIASGNATNWNIEWGPRGYSQPEQSVSTSGEKRYVLRGLTPGRAYQVKVRTDCGYVNGYSGWVVATNAANAQNYFVTECTTVAVPYSENFDNTLTNYLVDADVTANITSAANMLSVIPTNYPNHRITPCWQYSGISASNAASPTTRARTYILRSNQGSYHSGSFSLHFTNQATTQDVCVALPLFDYDIDTLTLSLWYRNNDANNGSPLQVGYMTDAGNPATFVSLASLPLTTTYSPFFLDYHSLGVDFPAGARMALRYPASSSATQYYVDVDDVVVDFSPACPDLTGLAVLEQVSGGVSLGWDAVGAATGYRIEYGEHGFIVGNGQMVYSSRPIDTILGLSSTKLYDFYVSARCGSSYGTASMVTARPACSNRDLPYTEAFENSAYAVTGGYYSGTYNASSGITYYSIHDLPYCWRFTNISSSNTTYPQAYIFKGAAAYTRENTTTTKSLILRTDAVESPVYATLPTFTAPIDSLVVRFDYKHTATSGVATLQLGYMTDPYNLNTFSTLATYSAANTNWNRIEIDLSQQGLAGLPEGTIVAFRYVGNNASNVLCLDSIVVTHSPECPTVQNIVFGGSRSSATTVSWSALAGASKYEIEYGRQGFTQGTGTVREVTTNSITLNLDANAVYDFYIVAYCGECYGDYGTARYRTLCADPVNTPYYEDFDYYGDDPYHIANSTDKPTRMYNDLTGYFEWSTATLPQCWRFTPEGSATGDWVDANATTKNNSVPKYWLTRTSGYSVTGNAFAVATGSGQQTTVTEAVAKHAYVVLPMLDKPLAYLSMSFNYRYYSADVGNTQIGYCTTPEDPASTFVSLNHLARGRTSITTAPVSLNFYDLGLCDTTHNKYIVIHDWYTGSNGWNSGVTFYMDNLSVVEEQCHRPLICADPEFIGDSVKYTWIEVEGCQGYTIEYGLIGFERGHGTFVNVPAGRNSITLGGLLANKQYDIYFQTNCSNISTSGSIKRTFTAPCGILDVPYIENFDSYLYYTATSVSSSQNFDALNMPTCWTFNGSTSPFTSGNSNYPYITNYAATSPYNHSDPRILGLKAYSKNSYVIAVLPRMKYSAADLTISFWYRAVNASYGTQQWGVISDPFDISTFEPIATLTRATTWNRNPASGETDLSSVLSDDILLDTAHYYYIAFRETATYNGNQGNQVFFIDDINIDAVNPCRTPEITADAVPTDDGATLSWSVTVPHALEYVIAYGTAADFSGSDPSTWSGSQTYIVPQNGTTVREFEYTLTGLTSGTLYRYSISGRNANMDCQSAWSTTATFTTTGDAPAAADCQITDLAVSTWGSDHAELSWSEVDGASSYQVAYGYRLGFDINDNSTYSVVNVATNSASIINLEWDTAYAFYVLANNCDEWSNAAYCRTPNGNTDIVAYEIDGIAGVIDHENHTITVTMPYGTDLSAIVSDFTLGATTSKLLNPGSAEQTSGTSSNDWSAAVGGVLTFTVVAQDATKMQAWQITVRVESCPTPTDFATDFVGRRRITYSWTQPGEEQAHDIVISSTPLDASALDAAQKRLITSGINTFDTVGLHRDTRYYAYLRANCGGGDVSNWVPLNVMTDDTLDCQDIISSDIKTINTTNNTTNNNNYNPVPLSSTILRSYTQAIYNQGSINHEAGWIKSITYNYHNGTAATKEITLYIGNTIQDNLTSAYIPVNQLTEVVARRCHTFNNSNSNWNEIVFDEPFYYTGNNLIVAVKSDRTNYCTYTTPTGSGFYSHSGSAANRFRSYNSTAATTDNEITFNAQGMPVDNNAIQAGTKYDYRPNVRFTFCHPIDICPAVTNLTATLDGEDPTEKANIAWEFDTADYLTGFEVIVSTNEIANPRGVMLANTVDKTTGDTLVYHINDGENTLSKALAGLRHNRQYYVYVRTNCDQDPDSTRSTWQQTTFHTTTNCQPVTSDIDVTITGKNSVYAQWERPNLSQVNNYLYKVTTTRQQLDTMKISDSTGSVRSTNNLNITGLACNTDYYLYVAAYCGEGDVSPWKESAKFTTPACCTQPVALTVNPITSNSATISWNSGQYGNETQWEVTWVYGNVADSQDNAVRRVVNSRTVDATDLIPNTQYRFHVRSICGVGNYSENAIPIIRRTLDTVSYFLTYRITSPTTVVGTLDFVNKTVDVVVPHGTNLTAVKGDFTMAGTSPIAKVRTTTQVTNSTLNDFSNGPIVYHLFAEDINYVHDWTVNVHYDPCPTPTVFTVTQTAGTTRGLTISWTQSDPEAMSHDIIINPVSALNAAQLEAYTGNIIHLTNGERTYNATGLLKNTTYYVYVRNVCANGNGAWTAGVSCATRNTSFGCPDLENFVATLTGEGTTTGNATWDIPTADYLSGYDLILSDTVVTNFSAWAGRYYAEGIANNYIDFSDLTPGTTYYIYGRAQCLADGVETGAKRFSVNWQGGTFHTYAECRAPEDMVSTPIDKTHTRISWTATETDESPRQDSNYIYVVNKRAIDAATLAAVNKASDIAAWDDAPQAYGEHVDANHVEIAGLQCDSSYYIYVANNCGNDETPNLSPWTEFLFSMPSCCPAPVNVHSVARGNDNITIAWERGLDGDETQWQVRRYYGLDDQLNTTADSFIVNTTLTYASTGLANNLEYKFQVRAICGVGDTSPWSVVICKDTTTMPYHCDFENIHERRIWTQGFMNQSTNKWWAGAVASMAYNGTNSIYITNNSGANAQYQATTSYAYATRQLHLTPGTYYYKYYWKASGSNNNAYMRVFLTPASFTPANNNSSVSNNNALPQAAWRSMDGNVQRRGITAFQYDEGYVGVPATGDYKLVFYWFNNTTTAAQPGAVVDEITFYQVCPPVENLLVDQMSGDTAVVSWEAPYGDDHWTLEYGLRGFTEGTGLLVNVSDNPTYVLRHLQPNTEYTVIVRTNCDGTSSPTARTYDFRTSCMPLTIPYDEDFNQYATADGYYSTVSTTRPSQYTTAAANYDTCLPSCWDFPARNTANNAYGPKYYMTTDAAAVASGRGLVFWSNYTGDPYNYAILPSFDKPIDSLQIEFSLYENNATNGGPLQIGYIENYNPITGNQGTFVSLYSFPRYAYRCNVFYDFRNDGIDVPEGARIVLCTRHTASNNALHTIVVDDIHIELAKDCPQVQNVTVSNITTTGARLEWDIVDEAERYRIAIAPAGVDEEDAYIYPSVTTPYTTFNNLTPGTRYTFYVYAYCGDAHGYGNAGTVQGTTLCNSYSLPYSEDFDSYGDEAGYYGVCNNTQTPTAPLRYNFRDLYLPSCWTFANRSLTTNGWPQVYIARGTVYDNSQYSPVAQSGNYSLYMQSTSGYNAIAALPTFELPIDSLTITFSHRDLRTNGNYGGPLQVGYMTDPNDPNTFVEVARFNENAAGHLSYFTTHSFDFTDYFANPVHSNEQHGGAVIAFRYAYLNGTSTLYLDDIVVDRSAGCAAMQGLAITEATGNTTLTWTAQRAAQYYVVEYGLHGFQQGTGKDTNVVGNSLVLAQILDTNELYDFYVHAYCASGNTHGPDTLVTYRSLPYTCSPHDIPYYEDFDIYAYNYTTTIAPATTNAMMTNISLHPNYTTTIYDIQSNTPQRPYCWNYAYPYNASYTHDYNNTDDRFPRQFLFKSEDWGSEGVSYAMGSARNRMAVAILPEFTEPAANLQLRLRYRFYDKNHGQAWLGLVPTVDAAGANAFIPVRKLDSTETWLTDSTTFYAHCTADDNYRLAIKYIYDGQTAANFTTGVLMIDSVAVTRIPSCATPTNLAVNASSAMTDGSVQVSWDGPVSASSYEIEYGLEGFSIGSGTRHEQTATSRQLSGLTSGLRYDIYLRGICGVGDTSGRVRLSFTAPCRPQNIPYVEVFDEYVGSADHYSSDHNAPVRYSDFYDRHFLPTCWTFDKSGTSFNSIALPTVSTTGTASILTTYPQAFLTEQASLQYTAGGWRNATGDVTTPKSLLLKTTNAAYGATGILPLMSSSLSALQITFYYRTHDAYSGTNKVQLGYVTGVMGATPQWTTLQEYPLTDHFTRVNYDFSRDGNSYPADAQIAIRWAGTAGTADYYLAIDSIVVDSANTCATVQNLAVSARTDNSVSLAWDAVAGASYRVATRSGGIVVRTDTVYANRITVGGLTAGTRYDFAVRALCSASSMGDSATISATPACTRIALPYVEHFDQSSPATAVSTTPTSVPADYAAGSHYLPSCWSFANLTSSATTYPQAFVITGGDNSGAPYAYQRTGGALLLRNDGAESRKTYAALPGFRSTTRDAQLPLDSLVIGFYYRSLSEGNPGTLEVGYMTDPEDANTFVALDQLTGRHDYQFYSHDYLLDGTRYPNGARIAFRFSAADAAYPVMIDEVVVEQSSDCKRLTNVTFAALTNDTAAFGCTDPGNALRYRVIYGEHPFFPTAGSGDTAYAATIERLVVRGLSGATAYDFYVSDSCACSRNYSPWVKLTAQTACTPSALPYTQNFDSYTASTYGGSQYANYAAATYGNEFAGTLVPCWTAMPRSSYYAADGYRQAWMCGASGYFAYDGYDNVDQRSLALKTQKGEYVYAVLPLFTANADSLRMSFKYRYYDNTLLGTAEVGVMRSPYDVSSFTTVKTLAAYVPPANSTPSQNFAEVEMFDFNLLLSGAALNYPYIAFRYTYDGTSTDAAFYVDDIRVEQIAECEAPVAEAYNIESNQALLGWQRNCGAADSYDVVFSTSRATLESNIGSLTPHNVTTLFDTIKDLSPNTTYYYAVRAVCGGDASSWSAIRSFKTTCDYVALPYEERFESYTTGRSIYANYPQYAFSETNMPQCWDFPGVSLSQGNSAQNYPQAYLTTDGTYTYANNGTSLALKSYNTTTPMVAILPPIEAHASLATIEFWYRNYDASAGRLQLGVTTSRTDPSKFRPVTNVRIDGAAIGAAVTDLTNSTSFRKGEYTFSAANLPTDTVYYLAFRFLPNGASVPTNVAYIDSIKVTTSMKLEVTYAYATSLEQWCAQAEWSQKCLNATQYELQYSNYPFTYTGDDRWVRSLYVSGDSLGRLIPGLTSGEMYHFRVRGKCGNGDYSDDWSNVKTLVMDCEGHTSYIYGTGTETSGSFIRSDADARRYSFSQHIYTPTDIVQRGWISAIAVNVQTIRNIASVGVYLSSTEQTAYTSTTDWQGATIYHAHSTWLQNGNTGWHTATFNQNTGATIQTNAAGATNRNPFYFDGTKSFVLGLDNNTNATNRSTLPLYVTSSPNSTLYIYGKTDVGAGGTGTLSDYKPNIKFTYTCPYNPAVCPTPTNVVNSELGSDTATFTWVAATTNSSRTWVVEWGPVGFDVNTRLGRDTIYATPRYTVKNLQSGTYYEFRVQTDCGLVNGVSTWINTPFQTNCGAEAIPYSEDFDIYTTDIVSAAALTAPTTFPDNKQANCWTYTGTTSLYNTAPFSQMFLTSYATYKLVLRLL